MGGECIYEDELRALLKKKPNHICCVWFDPSLDVDIEQHRCKIGSDLSKIRNIGYLNSGMWEVAGMDLDRVELVWLSGELNLHAVNYWPLAMDVSKKQHHEKNCKVLFSYFAFLWHFHMQTLNLFAA
ncbi:hypothetical protein ABZP36_032695 [Zizania latifolia]